MIPDHLYPLYYGHSEAALDFRKALELQAFSRESQALWQGSIPAATTLLSPYAARDIEFLTEYLQLG